MGRRKKTDPPAMRTHKRHGTSYVEIFGKQISLGPVGSREAAEAYRKIVDDWAKQHVPRPRNFAVAGSTCTIADLVASHHAHAEQHYRRLDGSQTDEVKGFIRSLAPILADHADRSPNDFRPADLRLIVERWVDAGLARETINKQLGRIKAVWKWGVTWDMVSTEAAGALLLVRGLQSGRTTAPDYEEVWPVPLRDLARTLRLVPDAVAAMIRVQYYCGARPGEVVVMRADEIHKNTIRVGRRSLPLPSGIWGFMPRQHKNLSKGKLVRYLLGPRLQQLLKPRMKDEFLFPSARRPHWRSDTYAQVIDRVCQEAGVRCSRCGATTNQYVKVAKRCECGATGDALEWTLPRWSPNQLRHNFLTRIDAIAGLEMGSAMVSHANVDTTAVYVQRDLKRAGELAAKIG